MLTTSQSLGNLTLSFSPSLSHSLSHLLTHSLTLSGSIILFVYLVSIFNHSCYLHLCRSLPLSFVRCARCMISIFPCDWTKKGHINFITCQLSTCMVLKGDRHIHTFVYQCPGCDIYQNQTCLTRSIEIRNWYFSLFFSNHFPDRMCVSKTRIQDQNVHSWDFCCRALKRTDTNIALFFFYPAIPIHFNL